MELLCGAWAGITNQQSLENTQDAVVLLEANCVTATSELEFCREEILAWWEGQPEVDYCLGLGKNPVLIQKLGPAMAQAQPGLPDPSGLEPVVV
ncbi:MAG TPA: hypothetical protein VN578_07355 [Candidatus Binatia bacterium]|jgi:hypothetical protein|nr:hypothetical protein [Candidatus Binatia bacterium]